MNEHERILEIIRTKNKTSTDLDPSRTALIVVDMFVEFGPRAEQVNAGQQVH